jgi:hypothetical protein
MQRLAVLEHIEALAQTCYTAPTLNKRKRKHNVPTKKEISRTRSTFEHHSKMWDKASMMDDM